MKDDAPAPKRIPKKRRVLESAQTLDRWIAEWLDRDDLTPSERRRLEVERERRKAARLMPDTDVGLLIGPEGITPAQATTIATMLPQLAPTSVVFCGSMSRRLAGELPDNVAMASAPDFQAVVRAADVVIAAPKKPHEQAAQVGVWAGVKYAKHRSVPVRIVLPNGEEAS